MMRKIINTPTQVKNINKRLILDIIRREGPISRASISRRTALSRATISNIITELIDDGFVIEAYTGNSMAGVGGKRPQLLTLNYEKLKYIGIDIYSDLFRIAVVNIKGDVLKVVKKHCSIEKYNSKDYLTTLREVLDTVLLSPEGVGVRGIGLSLPGNIVSDKGIVIKSTHMKWENVSVFDYFRGIHIPVVMDNRAVASLIGEIWFKDYNLSLEGSVFYMTVGEGVGGAIMVNNSIVRGMGMSAGEIGATIISMENGKGYCLENLVSDRVMTDSYLSLTKGRFPYDKTIIEFAREIVERANSGDKDALKIVKKGAEFLGIGIVNIINLILPKTIIITGSITHAWSIVLPIIWKSIKKYISPSTIYENLKIKKSFFQEDSTLFGGAALSAKHEFESIF